MSHFLYIGLDLATIILPFLFSFHPKIQFYRKFKAVFTAIFAVAVLFLIWDYFFTAYHYWGFTSNYLLGWYLLNLPLEEVLFFVVVPFACLYTFHCLQLFAFKRLPNFIVKGRAKAPFLFYIAPFTAFAIALFCRHQHYSSLTFTFFAVLLYTGAKYNWPVLRTFLVNYFSILLPFFIVNGILTGAITASPVVWYSPHEIIGVRFVTIPLEDFFYAFDLLFSIAWLAEALSKKSIDEVPSTRN